MSLFEQVFNGDPFYGIIVNYLSIKDLLTLQQMPEFLHMDQVIEERILSSIEYRLNKYYGDKTWEFKQLLEQCHGLISGSFLIQCILEEDWSSHKTDLDIYLPGRDTIEEDERVNRKYWKWQNNFSDLENFLYDFYDQTTTAHSACYERDLKKRIICVREYYRGKYQEAENKVQIIYVKRKHDQLTEFIESTFDFQICKNWLQFRIGQPQLHITNLREIVEKVTDFEYQFNLASSIRRMKKYEKRGFTFRNKETITQFIKEQKYNIRCLGPDYKLLHLQKVSEDPIRFQILNNNLEFVKEDLKENGYHFSIENDVIQFYQQGIMDIIQPDVHQECDENCPLIIANITWQHIHRQRYAMYFRMPQLIILSDPSSPEETDPVESFRIEYGRAEPE